MARELTDSELEKATRNLQRIELYLAPRVRWSVHPGDEGEIAALGRACGRLAARVHAWGVARTSAVPSEEASSTDELPPDTLDGAQIATFARFLERLDEWLESSDATPSGPGAAASVAALLRSLKAVNSLLAAISGGSARADSGGRELDTDSGAAAPSAPADRGGGPSPIVDDVYAGSARRERHEPPEPAEQIALIASEVNPLFRWVGPDEVELTPQARQLIEQLFASQGITFFRYQLENFIEEVQRRVASAPDGHVLVVKVRGSAADRKPFLSYVAAGSLQSDGAGE